MFYKANLLFKSKQLKRILFLTILTFCLKNLYAKEMIVVTKNSTAASPLKLIFSHNINGEVSPCGCRHFPLGGISQVAGHIHKLKKNNDLFYVDTGDLLFDTSKISDAFKESSTYNASELYKKLAELGLKILVPGENDLALGVNFLLDIAKKNDISILISNLKKNLKDKFTEYYVYQKKDVTLYFVGLTSPDIHLSNELGSYLNPIDQFTSKQIMKNLIEVGFDGNDKNHYLIILSHNGMDEDEKIAKLFPRANWIIGSHSQSMTSTPIKSSKVNIVQVLSRNHYLGEIIFNPWDNATQKISETNFTLTEISQELAKSLSPNPYISWEIEHKKKMNQLNEKIHLPSTHPEINQVRSHLQCLECHQKQYDFWSTTSHSLAFTTLVRADSSNNSKCIKCHINLGPDSKILHSKNDLIIFKENTSKKKEKTSEKIRQKKYWDEFKSLSEKFSSVRELSNAKRKKYFLEFQKLDQAHQVVKNHGGVQCLNCHDKAENHPLDIQEDSSTKMELQKHMQSKCLKCHTNDESIHWYTNGQLNTKLFQKKLKSVSCPKF